MTARDLVPACPGDGRVIIGVDPAAGPDVTVPPVHGAGLPADPRWLSIVNVAVLATALQRRWEAELRTASAPLGRDIRRERVASLTRRLEGLIAGLAGTLGCRRHEVAAAVRLVSETWDSGLRDRCREFADLVEAHDAWLEARDVVAMGCAWCGEPAPRDADGIVGPVYEVHGIHLCYGCRQRSLEFVGCGIVLRGDVE